jgi:hypothetical protein
MDEFFLSLNILQTYDAFLDVGHYVVWLSWEEVPVTEAPTASVGTRPLPTESCRNGQSVCWLSSKERAGKEVINNCNLRIDWAAGGRDNAKRHMTESTRTPPCLVLLPNEKWRLEAHITTLEKQNKRLKAKLVELGCVPKRWRPHLQCRRSRTASPVTCELLYGTCSCCCHCRWLGLYSLEKGAAGLWPTDGLLWLPGQFGGISGRWSSVALLPNSYQREVTKATVTRSPYKVITWINDVVYWIQHHPWAKMMIVHLVRLVPYLGAAWDEYAWGGSSVAFLDTRSVTVCWTWGCLFLA